MKLSKLVVLTGPSGVGKATIEKKLFENKNLKLRFSISATTREPRANEKDGQHYFFITKKEFDEKIQNNEFIEWNEHFAHKYGTLKSEINSILEKKEIPFIEVETEGAKNIIKQFAQDKIISIFIAPPSLEELEMRIKNRGSETPEQIAIRLKRVKQELQDKIYFNYIVFNDNLDEAVSEIESIIQKELN